MAGACLSLCALPELPGPDGLKFGTYLPLIQIHVQRPLAGSPSPVVSTAFVAAKFD